jgi:hypothetical protein
MQTLLSQLAKARLALISSTLIVLGLGGLILSRWPGISSSLTWLPVVDIGSSLFTTGLVTLLVDRILGSIEEQRQSELLRSVLKDQAAVMRDAVIEGFAVKPDDLARVATPELLDSIATNAMALRLGDADFAAEIYSDVRDQAIRAPERWYDVDVRIRLSSIDERSTAGTPRFDITVQWEYTTVPSHAVQRFACVSDRDEYHDLAAEAPATSTWFMTPRPGFDASDRDAYELVQYSVDGEAQVIRRSERRTGQTYSVNLGEDVVRAGKPVRISYVYRTITPQSGHRLFFDIEQPTRNFSLDVDYTATTITHLSVTDLVSSKHRTRISRLPSDLPSRSISAEVPGWIFPRAGFAFVWTLASEEAPRPSRADSKAKAA